MPPGAAAPCGLIAGSEQLFHGGHDQSLFACYFNLHKVVRHQLVPDGPTYQTVDTDLLACDHPDFHPTDVFEDADGSLLVVDTGGWYKVCCPTSQLAKPDVLGAIYRVRRRGSASPADPLGLQLPWAKNVSPAELASRLADPRLFAQLLRDGSPAIAEVRCTRTPHRHPQKLHRCRCPSPRPLDFGRYRPAAGRQPRRHRGH
ncbi:MAG UNVERIFIED_CONTAM: hypothetical protein LVR18_41280 [Planctomycetaceae bacterium]